MYICKCDICGKEISTWIQVKIEPHAIESYLNIAPLLQYQSLNSYCTECYELIHKAIHNLSQKRKP